MTLSPDDLAYRFLTTPGADLCVALGTDSLLGTPELQLFGNRAGLLSLANTLLWFHANAWRREFLSLAELPFVRSQGGPSVCLRINDEEPTGHDGLIRRIDRSEQFEWVFAEDDLRRIALTIHSLACRPGHEYDRLLVGNASAMGVHVRMTDAPDWICRGDV